MHMADALVSPAAAGTMYAMTREIGRASCRERV